MAALWLHMYLVLDSHSLALPLASWVTLGKRPPSLSLVFLTCKRGVSELLL